MTRRCSTRSRYAFSQSTSPSGSSPAARSWPLEKSAPRLGFVPLGEQTLVLHDAAQRAPFVPLGLAFQDAEPQLVGHQPDRQTVLNVHDELPLLPEHLLESLDLREEVDHVRADLADDPNPVEPRVRPRLAARDERAEAQNSRPEEVVQLPCEKRPEVPVDEEVGCPLAGEALGVVDEEGGRIGIARAAVRWVKQRLRGFGRRLQRVRNRRLRALQDGPLRPVLLEFLRLGGRREAMVEGHFQRTALCVPDRLVHPGEVEAGLSLDVVLFDVRGAH